MTDAGRSPSFHVCSFTTHADVRLIAGGDVYRFEFSERFGPLMLGPRGRTLSTVPSRRSAFWKALDAWSQQGCRLTADGEAIYELPPLTRYVQLVGKHYVPVPEGCEPREVRRDWFEKAKLPEPLTPPPVMEIDES